MLLYHHCRELEHIIYGEIKSNPDLSDSDFIGAYRWLEKEIGFYPLFLAVGEGKKEDLIITGYQDNWRRLKTSWCENGKYKSELRKAGEFPNEVLFSFESVDGVFNDYCYWHLVLNASSDNYKINDFEKRCIFKYSWPKSKWVKKAITDPGSVQLVTPTLYLPDAERIWVRNKKTKKLLELMGFENVEVKRIHVPKF